jgi:glucan 1,3-beta-glucosidase
MAFRGVNLGGWLVLERWISPAVFEGTSAADEYSLCRELGLAEARKRLEQHRANFITRDHISRLAGMGLTVLRLPVGHWLFEAPEPFVGGADTYVDRAFDWANEFGMQVILDVHAAPGSQNGWDHSGRAGTIDWPSGQNIQKTLQFVERLGERYGENPALYGIEVLNEPHWDVPVEILLDYYERSYQLVDRLCPPGIKVIFSDAFRPDQMIQELTDADLPRLILDIHLYQLFTPEDRALDLSGHLHKAAHEWDVLLARLTTRRPVMVGEWSAAMSELYNNVGGQPTYVRDDYIKYFCTQLHAFENHVAGWTYWTARTQDGGVWSLLDHPEFLEN